MADAFEKVEKMANSHGWYFRKLTIPEPCVSCHKSIDRGFVMSPAMNYTMCATCAEKEFTAFA